MSKLTFETFKKLGDAGFPYEDTIPTLSELIEACGEQFHSLVHKDDAWGAIAELPKEYKIMEYKTPEDAVAHLWLALNSVV